MKIKITTYNIHRAIGLDRRFRPQRIIDILNDIDADIVLLQEVDEGVPRSRELNLAKEISQACGYPYYALGHNVSLRKGYYGNATLSRFPIVRERNINLTIDNKKRRGCQHTTLSIENKNKHKEFDVFNLHLGLSAKERQKQAGILFHSSEYKKLDAKMPCIVAGDFNDWRSLLRALFVEGMGFLCATDKTTGKGEVAMKTFPSFAPRGGLDRIYYKGKIKSLKVCLYKKKVAKIASDHLPVSAEFEL
ncbi:MAG: endonuclease/exonuclease/phosphatase family protein [Alcanivoracaceae bacterium]|nr:endonuclease/exonuclease/phosphatase family protein [Alcanivoracaceae bacterium]